MSELLVRNVGTILTGSLSNPTVEAESIYVRDGVIEGTNLPLLEIPVCEHAETSRSIVAHELSFTSDVNDGRYKGYSVRGDTLFIVCHLYVRGRK